MKAKYVTFYWSIMGGIEDVEKFETKEEALKNFRRKYRGYFQLNTRFCPKDLPCSYGFYHRKYVATTIRSFNRIKKG